MILPEYDDTETGLSGYMNTHDIREDDKKNEYSFHFKTRLAVHSQIIKIIQTDPNSHRGTGKPPEKTITIWVTTRGITQIAKLIPAYKEVLTLGYRVDMTTKMSYVKDDIISNATDLPYFMCTRSSMNFYPGLNAYNVIMTTHEALGMTRRVAAVMYFIFGLLDYDTGHGALNHEIEEIANYFEYIILKRRSTLEVFAAKYLV